MNKLVSLVFTAIILVASGDLARAATTVPNEIQQPGTQPNQVGNLESPDKCDNCHGGYNQAVEPAFNWRGSMMANAGRDPIFWATMAVAEQDFDGAGDLCIRCHSTGGWYGGRSTPTDGSALTTMDADGVDCDTCHKMTNPNQSELPGVMLPPFLANNELTPATGYYGSGMLALSGGSAKLGPFSDAVARHQFTQSKFHRDISFCGSCHDVSNPAVGDLAHNNGRQATSDPVTASFTPGSALDEKAAFNNFPFQYGIVERTFSEYFSGALSKTLVSNYLGLPADLRAGAIKAAFDSAKGSYSDGTPRYYSCQTCHVRATTGVGCNKSGVPTRTDLPLHDMTGGNYWMPDAIIYQNNNGTLRLGSGLTALQIDAINAGKSRAAQQVQLAASLSVNGNTLKVTNLTGHKLISGYPEGRRMWFNIKWYDSANNLVREDGAYGNLSVTLNGANTTVKSLLNLKDINTKIYEAHYAMTQEWANQLLSLGYPASMALSYDRLTSAVDYTLGQLAAQAPGTEHETFHFVLNNTVAKDNRIPPYGFSYEEARKRNALPVPTTQYGSPSAGGTYNYWDEIALNPPAGAAHAEIKLLYQPTSWEYVQFLYRANNGGNAFLAQEGVNLLNAWLNTGMAEPHVMATATWETAAPSAITVTPASASFGSVALSVTSAPSTFTISNNGTSGLVLTVNSIAMSGPDAAMFQVNNGTCGALPITLTAGQACDFSVSFTPTNTGVKSASVTVSALGEVPVTIPLAGTGVSSINIAPASAAFGNVALNFTSTPIMFALNNNGASGLPLTINSITLTGGDAAMFNLNISTCLGSLAVGQSCNFSVTFAPTTAALKIASADLAVAGEQPVDLPLSGTGVTAFSQVRRTLPSLLDYTTLADAFTAATADTTLLAWGAVLPAAAGVTVNSTGIVNFIGGYDALFGSRTTGMTAMLGVTIQQGTLVVDGLTIQ